MSADEIEELRDVVAEYTATNPLLVPVFEAFERDLAEARRREAAVRQARRLSAPALL
ncbi:hypothetical protein JOD31_001515 [Methylopila capsulata]|uniref:Uncharacterized protein n=1 Tax=Methylopila capsulata TaxID=61654 RepID=A0A9W6IPX4_9HYPH|nr:hypothetical protein [Methylopila capsulata]MBM7851290.1 hypothetical protein [Methylopila capsulata]GLK54348.1 hypothetical protein GCM10008170_03670 [Methylopila capsulata]